MIFKLGLVTRANAEELVQLVAATTRYATEMRFFSRAVRELLMEQLQIHTHRRTQNTRTHRYVANDTSEAQKEPKQHFHMCPRSRSADALARGRQRAAAAVAASPGNMLLATCWQESRE